MSQVWSISATDFTQQIRILLEQSQIQLDLKLTVSPFIFSDLSLLIQINNLTIFYVTERTMSNHFIFGISK